MKKRWWTLIVILAVVVIVLIIKNQQNPLITEETARCIGGNSKLYIQLGCHACENQKELFGEKYIYLEVIDCFYDMDSCIKENITATPTWIIGKEKYVGVQTIEKLKEITGC